MAPTLFGGLHPARARILPQPSCRKAAGGSQKPSPHLVAGQPEGAGGVAVAGLAAGAAGQPPGVGRAAVAGLPHHAGQAAALPRGRLAAAALRAVTVLPHGAQVVADTLCKKRRQLGCVAQHPDTHPLALLGSQAGHL